MLNAFSTELLKLKHTKIHWLILLIALPTNLVSLAMFLSEGVIFIGSTTSVDLQDIFYRQGMILTILGPFMFAIMTGYIISREYQERTINQLFSYPVSRAKILLAKLCAVFTLIAITSALSCMSALVIGIIELFTQNIGFDAIWTGIKMNLLVCILSFGTVPVAAGISMVGKNIIPSAVLGVFVTVISLFSQIGHSMNVILFPWLTPYWPVRDLAKNVAETGPNPYAIPALIILSLTFIISLVFCYIYYTKSDVHSGS